MTRPRGAISLAKGPFGRTWREGDRVLKEAGSDFEELLPWGVSREVEVYQSGLSHPNVARMLAHGLREDGRPWLALEFIAGGTVRDRLISESPPALKRVLAIGGAVAEALTELHRAGFVHRDVHIHNVLVPSAEAHRAVLVDFGIAGLLDGGAAADRGLKTGSPRYAAPEQLTGAPQTTATDVWGLGGLLYCMLYRQAPYGNGATREPAVFPDGFRADGSRDAADSSAILAVLKAMLALKPRQRPSLSSVTDTLGRLAQMPGLPLER